MPAYPHRSFGGTPESVSEPRRLTREQVVDRIINLNPSSDADFLRTFSDDELSIYLQRLDAIQEPRGRRAVWVRRNGPPGISSRRHGR
ncbi:MAG: hypothetical protein KF866_02360 [Phycisphaeraceae bacterium]|nr:hypothetical protein [Phycisphaeraceae bacterium]MCW5753463.1 hypothetical protein [Phycisphaeraceae bacterium]